MSWPQNLDRLVDVVLSTFVNALDKAAFGSPYMASIITLTVHRVSFSRGGTSEL